MFRFLQFLCCQMYVCWGKGGQYRGPRLGRQEARPEVRLGTRRLVQRPPSGAPGGPSRGRLTSNAKPLRGYGKMIVFSIRGLVWCLLCLDMFSLQALLDSRLSGLASWTLASWTPACGTSGRGTPGRGRRGRDDRIPSYMFSI